MFNQIAANFKLGKGVKSSPKVQKSIRNYTTNSHFPQRTNFSHLSNGLGVATETIPGETATIGVYINTGSAQETHQNNGVSNFLSQVALKVRNNILTLKIYSSIQQNNTKILNLTPPKYTYFVNINREQKIDLKVNYDKKLRILGVSYQFMLAKNEQVTLPKSKNKMYPKQ